MSSYFSLLFFFLFFSFFFFLVSVCEIDCDLFVNDFLASRAKSGPVWVLYYLCWS